MVQKPSRREAVAQAPDEPVGERPLGRADGVGIPFARFEIVDRDEGRLAAHGQTDVVGDERSVDLLPERVERLPRLFREGFGDPRMLGDALDAHVEREIDIGEARDSRNRSGVAIVRGGGQRNVAFAGEQARGRVEADPAGARKIDLRPGVKVGEIAVRARRPVQRDEIRLELNQIAGDEASGKAKMAKDLHHEPARIAARARAALESLLRALHPRLHANEVFDLLGKVAIEVDHEVHGALRRTVDSVEPSLQPRSRRVGRSVDDQVRPQVLSVLERPDFRAFFDEEIEGIVDRHVGDDVDLDPQFVDQIRKSVAREPVAVRVLLKVHEMIGAAQLSGNARLPLCGYAARASAG